MVIIYKEREIGSLEDIQKLKVKDLKEILRSNLEATGGTKLSGLCVKIVCDPNAKRASTGRESPGK